MRDIYQVIDTVRMSEKAALLQENDNTYTFKVAQARQQDRDQASSREALQGQGPGLFAPATTQERPSAAAAPTPDAPHAGRKQSSVSRMAIPSTSSNSIPLFTESQSERIIPMPLKSFKPVTPANRYKMLPGFDEITKSKPEKSLLEV